MCNKSFGGPGSQSMAGLKASQLIGGLLKAGPMVDRKQADELGQKTGR